MEEFSPLDRFLLFASVGGMFASLAFYAAQRTARFWKEPFVRFTRSSRAAQTLVIVFLIAITAIGGNKGGTNDPPLRAGGGFLRTIPPENLPAWFVERGYPATDADGSGIPDCWEKWTHTRGFAADADADGDGLTNLAEFEAQTDPIRADTDGDGIDDATELAGLAAGVPDLNPVVPATFAADEPDADGDGIPDVWEDSYPWTYEGVDDNGFPLWFDFPAAGEDNYDVRATVNSSRHALLSWGGGESESILLPPCTNLALRLRLSVDDDRRISLTPHPATGAATGLWKAELVAAWDSRRNQETEANRVRTGGGTIIDAEKDGARFIGVFGGTIPRMRGAPSREGGRDETGIWFWRKSIELSGTAYCAIHGPALVVTATCENVSPPLEWSVTGKGTVLNGGTVFVPSALGWESASTEVVCTKRDGKSRILLQAQAGYDAVPCGRPQTNIVGACTLSSHDPLDPSDHAPRIEEHVVRYLPQCPPTTNVTVVAGFTHDTAILWIRNLVRIVTGDPWDDETDHCISFQYDKSSTIDLWNYLSNVCTPYRHRFVFKVNGSPISGHSIKMSEYSTIDDLKPRILHVSFSLDGSRELDRMWIVIYATSLKDKYDIWKTSFASTAWTAVLPAVHSTIGLITNAEGRVSIDESRTYSGWKQPDTISSYLHHNAVYEMRSEPVGNHGHQATYREDGTLITTTISAGTADYYHPLSFGLSWNNVVVEQHYVNDVIPFLRAISLDGNPGIYNDRYVPTNLTRPCLYQGQNLNDYISRRPTLPTGTTP